MCELLGIDANKTLRFELHCDVNELPRIKLEQYVQPLDVRPNDKLLTEMKEYRLVHNTMKG